MDEGRGIFIPDKESADDVISLFKKRLRDLKSIKAEKDYNKAHPGKTIDRRVKNVSSDYCFLHRAYSRHIWRDCDCPGNKRR